MKKIISVLLVLFVAGFVFAGGQQDTGMSNSSEVSFAGNYAFGGSTTVEPIIRAAAEAFTDMYPEVKISYDAPGSSAGVRGPLEGTYSIGAASRSLKASEIEAGAVATAIAKDGVAVIVNKGSVPFDNMSLEDVIAIFAGDVTNWNQIGGPDAPIVVFNRDEASGTRSCFDDATVKTMKKKFTDTAAIVTSNGDMVAKVGSTPFSIGYCGFGYIGKDAGSKDLTVDGIAPEPENVLNGSYAVSRELILITKGPVPAGTVEEAFINYILSAEGQSIVKEEDFIPMKN
ncbi:phosphate ABC transporter substrate-binding protein [Oceanispirochaeta sp.]|jgi:phosphate transport system substrate-binding protein|uniref:phosphate ABC transporter substrate-binding protein n=1 Tax=Oceanispirochaeta sp. TaxID=2035350 RepID=UPI00260478CF|nr:phosphate ABC transporter substrate-binding protein [Oceanispirochaeta sp.]MDA3959142.1 phosphate ABC transporter substrate-binding protein [Oceanispirochaeta sp.]